VVAVGGKAPKPLARYSAAVRLVGTSGKAAIRIVRHKAIRACMTDEISITLIDAPRGV
jgi:hypothetical protein